MEEIPLSLWLWLCLGLAVASGSVQQSVGDVGWIGPPGKWIPMIPKIPCSMIIMTIGITITKTMVILKITITIIITTPIMTIMMTTFKAASPPVRN